VPIGGTESEVFLHRLSCHNLLWIIMVESERVVGHRPLILNGGDIGKEFRHR
jgi:hypothetical protein